MSGGGKTEVSQTKSEPWDASQPYYKGIFQRGQELFNEKKGFNYPGFSTVVDYSPESLEAMRRTANMARAGDQATNNAYTQVNSLLARGGGLNTEKDLRGLLNQSSNPYFQGVVDNQAGKLATDIANQFGTSGRFGSASMTGAIANQVGDFRQQALSDNWNQNIANQRGIIGDISGVQGQNASNIMGAAQMAPSLWQAKFAPLEKLAGVGAQKEDYATRLLNDKLARFNAEDNGEWQRLAGLSALLGGGSLGGTTTQYAQKPMNWLSPFGGALTGFGMSGGNPLMALLGGLGGLGGMFG